MLVVSLFASASVAWLYQAAGKCMQRCSTCAQRSNCAQRCKFAVPQALLMLLGPASVRRACGSVLHVVQRNLTCSPVWALSV